jgi:hypothetical protein
MYMVYLRWRHKMKAEHGWLSVFSPPLDDQLVHTRAQRFSVLLVQTMAALALNAATFGRDPEKVSGTGSVRCRCRQS